MQKREPLQSFIWLDLSETTCSLSCWILLCRCCCFIFASRAASFGFASFDYTRLFVFSSVCDCDCSLFDANAATGAPHGRAHEAPVVMITAPSQLPTGSNGLRESSQGVCARQMMVGRTNRLPNEQWPIVDFLLLFSSSTICLCSGLIRN